MVSVRGPANESYADFYAGWREAHKQQLHMLASALSELGKDGEPSEDAFSSLVGEVKKHYDFYYDAKAGADRQDVVSMLVPAWSTSLEKVFMWIGGWRPSAGFHLLEALSGQCLSGASPETSSTAAPTMERLSDEQIRQLECLSRAVLKEEEGLTYKLAELQQSLGDEPMVSLAPEGGFAMFEGVEQKLGVLEDIVVQADDLRKRTLGQLLGVLSSVQAAQFLFAVGQLDAVVSRVRDR